LSTLKLPKPENWPERSVRLALGGVLFGAGGFFSAAWAAIFGKRGDGLTAAVLAGFAIVALGFATAVILSQLGQVTVDATHDSIGTKLKVDRVITLLFTVALVAAVPSGVLFVIFVPRGTVGIPMSSGERIFTPYLIGIGVVFAVVGLIAMVTRGGPGYILLTPQGFEITGIFFTRKGLWEDVINITDESPDKRTPFTISIIMRNDPPRVIQGAYSYTPCGRGLYWILRHYWSHQENRQELIDGRALERLRNERFEVN